MKKYTYLRNLREEVQDLESSDPACMRKLLNIMQNALGHIAELEDELERVKAQARGAANVASCLANGIIPD